MLTQDGLSIDKDATDLKVKGLYDYYFYSELIASGNVSDASPLTFNPVNCLKNQSWVLPKIAASQIAIVGNLQENAVMSRINNYMVALQKYWAVNNVNELYLVYYETQEELTNYIASDTYLFPDEGICFGISVEKNSQGEYDSNLIFDDQKQYGGSLGMGVPATNADAWDPTVTKPNFNDYTMLSYYGYAFAQNVVANAILQEETSDDTAFIATMNVPLPSDRVVVDDFGQILSGIFPFFIILVYLGPIYQTIYSLV